MQTHSTAFYPSFLLCPLSDLSPSKVELSSFWWTTWATWTSEPTTPKFYETPRRPVGQIRMKFTDGYAANPVCSPTRFGIQTGRYPTRKDATNFFSGRRGGRFDSAPLHDRMDLEEVTIAEALKKKGYATFFAGKWHLGRANSSGRPSRATTSMREAFPRRALWRQEILFPYGNPRLSDGPDGEHLPDRLASETCAFIEKNKGKPFFAMLSFYSVHTR